MVFLLCFCQRTNNLNGSICILFLVSVIQLLSQTQATSGGIYVFTPTVFQLKLISKGALYYKKKKKSNPLTKHPKTPQEKTFQKTPANQHEAKSKRVYFHVFLTALVIRSSMGMQSLIHQVLLCVFFEKGWWDGKFSAASLSLW